MKKYIFQRKENLSYRIIAFLLAIIMVNSILVAGIPVFAESFVPTYVHAYDGTPTSNTYTATEVSGKTPAQIISGQRVNVTAPFDGFQIYMANGNVYYFTLSVYRWTADYETTIQTTPLKTKDMTLTNGAIQAKSFEWSDGALPAGDYFFVVEKTESKSTVTTNPNRLGLAEVASTVSKGEYYRVGTLTTGKELALDIRFTEAEPTGGYFDDVFVPEYVHAYDGTPTGNTYTAAEVSGKTPAQIISGQRVNVTAPFNGFQIYMSNGNVYNFTLSVYQWTDDYETTIQTTPLRTKDMTLTNGVVEAKTFKWSDGVLPAGDYFFVVEKTASKSTVTSNPNRLGLAEVASTVSKGEYYRVGTLTTGKELALNIRFTEAEPTGGYFDDVFVPEYVHAYDGTPTGNTYTQQEVSGKTPAQIISGQRVNVTAPFNGFQIYMANGNVYYFTLSVYQWTDDYETTIQTTPLKTKDMTLTNGAVEAKTFKWSDGALPAGDYFFVVEKTESKSTVTSNPNRLGLAEVASTVSKGEYYRVGTLTTGKELALNIRFTEAEPTGGYFDDVFVPEYVHAYDGTPTGNTYTPAEVAGKTPAEIITGQRVNVTAPFNGFQIYMSNGNVYYFTMSVYQWTDDFETTIQTTPLKTKNMTLTNGVVEAKTFKWSDGSLPAGEYLFVVEKTESKSTVTTNPNRLGLAEVASTVSKGEYYRVGTFMNGKELALNIRFTAPEPTNGYFAYVDNNLVIVPGDSNRDGCINVLDFIRLKKKIASGYVDSETDDLNNDGEINSSDLTLLIQYLLGSINSFPYELENNELPFVQTA